MCDQSPGKRTFPGCFQSGGGSGVGVVVVVVVGVVVGVVGVAFPADYSKPVPMAVVSLDSR